MVAMTKIITSTGREDTGESSCEKNPTILENSQGWSSFDLEYFVKDLLMNTQLYLAVNQLCF